MLKSSLKNSQPNQPANRLQSCKALTVQFVLHYLSYGAVCERYSLTILLSEQYVRPCTRGTCVVVQHACAIHDDYPGLWLAIGEQIRRDQGDLKQLQLASVLEGTL